MQPVLVYVCLAEIDWRIPASNRKPANSNNVHQVLTPPPPESDAVAALVAGLDVVELAELLLELDELLLELPLAASTAR